MYITIVVITVVIFWTFVSFSVLSHASLLQDLVVVAFYTLTPLSV